MICDSLITFVFNMIDGSLQQDTVILSLGSLITLGLLDFPVHLLKMDYLWIMIHSNDKSYSLNTVHLLTMGCFRCMVHFHFLGLINYSWFTCTSCVYFFNLVHFLLADYFLVSVHLKIKWTFSFVRFTLLLWVFLFTMAHL